MINIEVNGRAIVAHEKETILDALKREKEEEKNSWSLGLTEETVGYTISGKV